MSQTPARPHPVDPDRKDESEIERDAYMNEARIDSTQFGVGREDPGED
jgi:hypothetical protein